MKDDEESGEGSSHIKIDRLKNFIDEICDGKNQNGMTGAISKSMDFEYMMPEEFKEHRQARQRYKVLAKLAAKECQHVNLERLSGRL